MNVKQIVGRSLAVGLFAAAVAVGGGGSVSAQSVPGYGHDANGDLVHFDEHGQVDTWFCTVRGRVIAAADLGPTGCQQIADAAKRHRKHGDKVIGWPDLSVL